MGISEPLALESVAYFVDRIKAATDRTVARPGVVVLVGGATWQHRTQVLREFATTHRYYYVPLGLELSRALEPIAPAQRPRRVEDLTRTLTRPPAGEEFRGSALNHLEILFLREFNTYLKGKGRLRVFRTEAIRAGFSKAWKERDYDTILKVAERLPSRVIEEDPNLLMYVDNARLRSGK